MRVKYQISELRALIMFVKAQRTAFTVKGYITDRAYEMGMSESDVIDDLITSGLDLLIDRIYNQPYGGFTPNN